MTHFHIQFVEANERKMNAPRTQISIYYEIAAFLQLLDANENNRTLVVHTRSNKSRLFCTVAEQPLQPQCASLDV